MEKFPVTVWIMNVVGLFLIIFLFTLSVNEWRSPHNPPQTMSVSATGKVSMVPDLAIVTVGVISEGATAMEVKNNNSQKMNQVIAFIKQQGIDPKDIQTTSFNSSPKYNYSNGQTIISGYQANQTITIKVRHVDKSTSELEKIVNGAIMNGANQIQDVSFSFSDNEQLSQAARKQAIDKAKLKAAEIANEAGLTLGRIVNVVTSESNGNMPMPYAMANASIRTKSNTPRIEPGSQETTESVTLIFQIKPD